MSATNKTTNYELPIFVGTDKPAWLVDWNGAMTAIDRAIHTVEGKADQAGTDIGGIESSISTINSTLTSLNSAVSQLRTDTNANTGSINTITSLIGNGQPTTTDKTLIGAINELNDDKASLDIFNLKAPATPVTVTYNPKLGANVPSGVEFMNVLINDDQTLGKVYGQTYAGLTMTGALSADEAIVTLTVPGLSTPSAFDVRGYSAAFQESGAQHDSIICLHFNVGNTIEIRATGNIPATRTSMFFSLPPCLLILKDLGD